jgi:hypothetical protein
VIVDHRNESASAIRVHCSILLGQTHDSSGFTRILRSFTMVRKGKDVPPVAEEHPGGGHIVVTAQQSRYALDAVDAPASKEVSDLLQLLLQKGSKRGRS